LLDRVGDPGLTDADVAALQRMLVDTGAVEVVEQLVDELTARAIEAIEAADVTAEARDELVVLARFVASRDA
jgi:geranylgeranyl diphosphate synthase type I